MSTECSQRALGDLAIYHHFHVTCLCFHLLLTCMILSTPYVRIFQFRILHRTTRAYIAPLVLEAIDITPLSPTPAPLLCSGEILELGLF